MNNMVDYQEGAAVSTPPTDLLKIQILERRAYLINEIEKYHKAKIRNITPHTHELAGNLLGLFSELHGSLKRDLKPEAFKALQDAVMNGDGDQLVEAYFVISVWLDTKKLTRFDSQHVYDSTNVESENMAKNL